MEPYLRYLNTYVSVSGPHLGYLYSSNSLFNSGMWLLKKLKSTVCIHQLTFTDDPDLKKTFFYKLSQVLKCTILILYQGDIFFLSESLSLIIVCRSSKIVMFLLSAEDTGKF